MIAYTPGAAYPCYSVGPRVQHISLNEEMGRLSFCPSPQSMAPDGADCPGAACGTKVAAMASPTAVLVAETVSVTVGRARSTNFNVVISGTLVALTTCTVTLAGSVVVSVVCA